MDVQHVRSGANAWKFQTRDHRKTKTQKIEFDALAPDTADEIFLALDLLETWTGKAYLARRPHDANPASPPGLSETDDRPESPSYGGALAASGPADRGTALVGRCLLQEAEDRTGELEILAESMENSRRKVVVLKAWRAYRAYRDMLLYYAVKSLLDYWTARPGATCQSMAKDLAVQAGSGWVNLGGQLVSVAEVDRLRIDIKSKKLDSWDQVHARYEALWAVYPLEKQRHALATLLRLFEAKEITPTLWNRALDEAVRIQQYVCDQVYCTRKKDADDPFRRITFRNAGEMLAVLGSTEENGFVRQVRQETEAFTRLVARVHD